jgi:hypothetical protein
VKFESEYTELSVVKDSVPQGSYTCYTLQTCQPQQNLQLQKNGVFWVLTRATRRNNPEDTILHSHRRENLKSYTTAEFADYTAVLATDSDQGIASQELQTT